jgi:hypothetical protein
MALKMSTGLRNQALAGTGGSIRQIFSGGIIRLYTGDSPASPDSAVTGSLICTFSAATFGTGTTAGTMSIAGSSVTGTCGIAGTAGYFRLSEAGDGGTASTTVARLEGAVGKPDATGVDLTLVDTVLLAGQPLTITQATLGFPAS